MLAMMLFVTNYAMSASWNIRAQSAADSASAAGLSVVANIYNEESTILYATALDEYRLRVLNQAVLNTIWHYGGCSPAKGGSCEQNYRVLVQAYGGAEAAYKKDMQLLGQADNFTQGGQVQAEATAAVAGYGAGCGAGSQSGFDCSFAYTTLSVVAAKSNGNHFAGDTEVEVIACRNVNNVAGGLFGIPASFQAVGHGMAAATTASQQTFTPSTTNPSTGNAYQPTESQWYGTPLPFVAPAYEVSFGTAATPTLTVQVNWYNAVPVRPTTTATQAGSYACQ
jgi:hypothetical protein